MEASGWVRLVRPSSGGAGRRLVCFPHAGGAASWFVPLARELVPAGASAAGMPAAAGAAGRDSEIVGGAGGGDGGRGSDDGGTGAGIDVFALQYPARQDRLAEPGVDSMSKLVEAVVAELDGWLDRPFVLFGHSMGAVVAYEVARALEQRGEPAPQALVVSGRRAPSTWRDEHVHRGGDTSLLREVARLAGTPAELMEDDDVRQLVLPALRADYRALETYVWEPGTTLTCPVWSLVGEADSLTTLHEAAAWADHTTGSFELRSFPGGHFYLTDHLPEVAAVVTQVL